MHHDDLVVKPAVDMPVRGARGEVAAGPFHNRGEDLARAVEAARQALAVGRLRAARSWFDSHEHQLAQELDMVSAALLGLIQAVETHTGRTPTDTE